MINKIKLNIQKFASGTIEFSWKTGDANWKSLQGKLVWSSVSNGSSANTSTVTVELWCHTKTGGTSSRMWSGNININGNNSSFTKLGTEFLDNWIDETYVKMWTHSATVNHNANGTCTITLSGSITGPSGTSLAGLTSSGSQQVTLDRIPRASTITLGTGYIEQGLPITITKMSDSFHTKLYYKFMPDNDYTYIADITEKSYSWIIPSRAYQLIPLEKSIGVMIKAETYDGNTMIGEADIKPTTVYTNEQLCKPLINNPTIVESVDKYSQLTGSNTRFIKGISNPTISFQIEPRNSATVSVNDIFLNNTIHISSPYTVNPWLDSYTINVVDSRGYPNSYTFPLEVVPYFTPTITPQILRESPTSSTAFLSINGKFFNDYFDVAELNKNSATFEVKYKSTEVSDWENTIQLTPTIEENGNYYLSQFNLGDTFDYQKSYNFQVSITDSISKIIYNGLLIRGEPIIAWTDSNVTINGDLIVNENTNIIGNLSTNGTLKVGSIARNKTDTGVPVLRNGYLDYTSRDLPNAVCNARWETEESRDYLATLRTLALWDGSFDGTNSNLNKCARGTIASLGDIPTQEINSYSTNSNNGYIRFTNGIQIAWKSIQATIGGTLWTNNIYYSDHSLGNWGVAFTSLFLAFPWGNTTTHWFSLGGESTTSAGTLRSFRPNNGKSTIYCGAIGIGYWK